MSTGTPSDDDSDGDLGLGDGLKPGALPNLPADFSEIDRVYCRENGIFSTGTSVRTTQNTNYEDRNTATPDDVDSEDESDTDSENLSDFELSLLAIQPVQELKDQYRSREPSKRSTETFPVEKKAFGNCLLDCDLKDNDKKEFPIFADIPYGTSIRQQKELFNHNIEELKKKHTSGQDVFSPDHSSRLSNLGFKHGQQLSSEEIAMELAKRLQEVEELKNELETCESRLDSKYKAIDILKTQAEEAQLHFKSSEKLSRETTVKLAQVCYTGGGGGGIAYSELADQDLATMAPTQVLRRHKEPEKEKENTMIVPREKYNRVCKENASLLSALEAKTEELRKVTAQKMAVERENDELLALLDIQERAKYEKSRSVSSEEEYCTFNSTELAILGACRCRIISPNPCGCAHAAANLKKEVVRYKQEIHQYKIRRDEAFLTVDAYRKAFEEQLERSKALTVQLANLTTSTATKTSKARMALKWLMGTLNDDDIDYDSDSQTSNGPMMSEQEFTTYLIEMLNEKKEVLAHQKLMSQILGDRLKTAEEKLLKYETKDEVFS